MSIRIPILEGSVVVNVALFSDEQSATDFFAATGLTRGALGGEIGYTWNGSAYIKPTVPEAVVPVPTSVTPYQARKALKDAGVLPSVLALMASLDEDDDARMAWEYATEIRRESAFINTLGPALGLTSEQIDDLFRAAAQVV